jgi:hypothetical protein
MLVYRDGRADIMCDHCFKPVPADRHPVDLDVAGTQPIFDTDECEKAYVPTEKAEALKP